MVAKVIQTDPSLVTLNTFSQTWKTSAWGVGLSVQVAIGVLVVVLVGVLVDE